MPRPVLIAHRGASAHSPENTIAAFERALEFGADWIELDLQQARDGVVVFHDDKLTRLTGQQGTVFDRAKADLAQLRVDVPGRDLTGAIHIPGLEELLEQFGARCPLYLELKSDGGGLATPRNAQLLATVLEQVPSTAPHALASFDAELVRAVLEAKRKAVYIFAQLDQLDRLSRPELSSLFALSARQELLEEGVAARAQELHVPLWVWTVDLPADIERAIEQGVAGICSNDVPTARGVLDRLSA